MIFPGGGASLADSAYFSAGKMIYDLAIKVSGLCADRVNDYNLVIISCRDFMIFPGMGREGGGRIGGFWLCPNKIYPIPLTLFLLL